MLENAAPSRPKAVPPSSGVTAGGSAPAGSRFTSTRAFRDAMVEDLRRQLFGPVSTDPEEDRAELMLVSPLQIYATGVLFPQRVIQQLLEEADEADEKGEAAEDPGGDLADIDVRDGKRGGGRNSDEGATSIEREPLNLANEFSPSACGISFRISGPVELKVIVTYGVYKTAKHVEEAPFAGETGLDGKPRAATRTIPAYRRTPHEHTVALEIGAILGEQEARIVDPDDPELKLHVTVRRGAESSLVVSAMLVNHRSVGKATPANEDCYFQVALEVVEASGAAVFLPIDRDIAEHEDGELASLELLYRHRRAFALGHGVAGDWHRNEHMSREGRTDCVKSAALPTYELQPIKARETGYGEKPLQLSMAYLSGEGRDREADVEILAALRSIADDYLLWIGAQSKAAVDLPAKLASAAKANLDNCRRCHARMLEGIAVLAGDAQAMLAFRLMNRAMLVQQFHSSLEFRAFDAPRVDPPAGYRNLPRDKGNWRPFQLAFVLMNVAGMTRSDHPERRLVDLIWFPTGGGKTEAYLGLSAYVVCLERMRGGAGGVTVLMRYTLRLLTAQQFQRASTLILALEEMRRCGYLGADLGDKPISIGLWVGDSLSPNKRAAAKKAVESIRTRTPYFVNPFQVLQCPWCAVEMDNPDHLGYALERAADTNERTMRFVCPDDNCTFSKAKGGMPICVVDEDIYTEPPTLLIGTVDKFAQVSWRDEVGRLFGLGGEDEPPSLIIQDELHLISGPLGTVVGLYETAIDRMCSRDGRVHKIVASTATIRRAQRQCVDLYAREAFEFPPPALQAGESYFAYEDKEAPGRLYVGFLGTAVRSHQTALVRACAPLLQSAAEPVADDDEKKRKVIDPYGTLVWYFNSLRELGHAATLSVGDIPEFLKGLRHRLGIAYQDSRFIREIVELTSRCSADQIPAILKQLSIPWRRNPKGDAPVDILLATNMIAVGVDVPRLGLFVMSGQPKSTSEYIQATSRVGRNHPGLVVTVYTQSKSRDRSHYERFVAYHQSIYRHVEPTSVTPFSPQARERGMRGVLIALARQLAGVTSPDMLGSCEDRIEREIEAILNRIALIDRKEMVDAREELDDWLDFWRSYLPPIYGPMAGNVDENTLAYPFGAHPDDQFQTRAWPVPTSMRNVDGTCLATVLANYETAEEDA